jgi:hypothetical protein
LLSPLPAEPGERVDHPHTLSWHQEKMDEQVQDGYNLYKFTVPGQGSISPILCDVFATVRQVVPLSYFHYPFDLSSLLAGQGEACLERRRKDEGDQ